MKPSYVRRKSAPQNFLVATYADGLVTLSPTVYPSWAHAVAAARMMIPPGLDTVEDHNGSDSWIGSLDQGLTWAAAIYYEDFRLPDEFYV